MAKPRRKKLKFIMLKHFVNYHVRILNRAYHDILQFSKFKEFDSTEIILAVTTFVILYIIGTEISDKINEILAAVLAVIVVFIFYSLFNLLMTPVRIDKEQIDKIQYLENKVKKREVAYDLYAKLIEDYEEGKKIQNSISEAIRESFGFATDGQYEIAESELWSSNTLRNMQEYNLPNEYIHRFSSLVSVQDIPLQRAKDFTMQRLKILDSIMLRYAIESDN